MKNTLMVSSGEYLAVRLLKGVFVVLLGFVLALSWTAGTSTLQAQDATPQSMLQAELPEGQTVQTAAKADFLAAVCAAVKRNRNAAPQIVRFAVEARPQWRNDILRSAFSCLGTGNCRLLNGVLRAAIAGSPDNANELTELAIELAPDCSGAFGGGAGAPPDDDIGEGVFGQAPGNINPPPGSVGGGGGQGNVVAVCINGVTRFFTPNGAEDALQDNPGATLGACQVTPDQND